MLKQMAELATPGPWEVANKRYGGVIRGGPLQDFINGSAQSQIVMCCGAEWMEPGQLERNAEFIAAANPAVVLDLIAENEALRSLAVMVAKKLRSAEICNPRAVEFLLNEAREAVAHYLPKGWPLELNP
ncbi:ead/Ea22-like family protein [Pseudomonas fluorescens]|uniref:ead/Ea22-like family protein n=1 Tax=Pseudomonas fluorescens TaxID=294 RepID=UPI00123EDC7D|nr:ead/Ea22-like family protein [Pseudomonas fluorescens]